MPVKRRIVKQRLAGQELTNERLYFLIKGFTPIGSCGTPFSSDDEPAWFWRHFRKEILSQRSETPAGFSLSYKPGTRPWAFWIFDQSLEQPPDFEFAALDRMGLIDAQERAEAAELAREAWARRTLGYIQPWKTHAARITDGQLLEYWPSVPDIDATGALSWSTNDPRRVLTDHRRG